MIRKSINLLETKIIRKQQVIKEMAGLVVSSKIALDRYRVFIKNKKIKDALEQLELINSNIHKGDEIAAELSEIDIEQRRLLLDFEEI